MQIIIDLPSRLAITAFGNNAPAPAIVIKSQDTAVLNVYFSLNGLAQDLGSGTSLKFGLIASTAPTLPLLVLDTSFTRQIDASGNVFYEGFPVFNNETLLGAIGSSLTLSCTAELRYQQPDGEIAHSQDIPFMIWRTILGETYHTTTTGIVTQPACGATVDVPVLSSAFLAPGQTVSVGSGYDTMTVVSVPDSGDFVGRNMCTGSTAPGSGFPTGTIVALASPNVLATYPDVGLIQLKIEKDQPSGYAGLSSAGSGYISNVHVLVDGNTITNTDPAGLAAANKLTSLTASFVQPAASSSVVVTVASSAELVTNQAIFIDDAGFYLVTNISGTSVTLQNNGDPFNVTPGTTVPNGAALIPAQAVSSGGAPGLNAYTNLSSGFEVPGIGSTVTISVGNTAWMGGLGAVLFIEGAGYYLISSILTSTTVSITNPGYPGNAAALTNISSGAAVVPGGLIGSAGAAGLTGNNAYDKTTASFVMPAASAPVNVTIGSTSWLAIGQVIYIASAGYFSISGITNATTFVAENLNYIGNASAATTIASGSAVSPGGVIGPAGAGGAGKNAFTTLTANYTQPPVNATVSIQVATTAFMAVGQALFVQGGGYYTVSSITDLTDVVVTNLGYSANAAVGATVSASGTIPVVPSGTQGLAGTSSFTTTTASFTMPTPSAAVSVPMVSTAWLAAGQNVYIPGAGYFSVSSITSGTVAVLTNLGISGNASSGTTIASGSQVVASGAQGPAGPAGSGGGGGGSLADAGSTGVSLIASSAGLIKRLYSSDGSISLTDAGTYINHTLGTIPSGAGLLSPDVGICEFDDFLTYATGSYSVTVFKLGWWFFSTGAGWALTNVATGVDSSNLASGVIQFAAGASGRCSLSIGTPTDGGALNNTFAVGMGALDLRWRVWNTAVDTAANYNIVEVGMFSDDASGNIQNGIMFEYNVATGGNWFGRVYSATAAAGSTTGIAVAIGSWQTLRIVTNAAWTSIQFYVGNTLGCTVTSGYPVLNKILTPRFWMKFGAGTPTNNVRVDYCWYRLSVAR